MAYSSAAATDTIESIAPEGRHDPEVRRRFSGPAMRAFLNIAERWKLTVKERQALLGWPSTSAYHKYKKGDVSTLSYDTLTRISIILGIFKNLHILYADEQIADSWVKLPNSNPLFGKRRPIDFMAGGDIDSMYVVRRLLDGRRGGRT